MAHVKVAFIGAKHPHIFPRLKLAQHYAERCEVVGVYDSDAGTLDHIHRTYVVPTFDLPLAAARVVEPDEQGMSYYRQLGARYRAAAHIVRRLE